MKQAGFTIHISVKSITYKAKSCHFGVCPVCEWTSLSCVSVKHTSRNVVRHIRKRHCITARKAA